MIWGTPAAAWALVALILPILIHTLVRRRAPPTPFPTLRFIPHTRLASIERRALEDIVLLAVRLFVLTAAVAASAGPFVLMKSRRDAWDATTIRAEVVAGVPSRGDAERSFSADTASTGIREATAWLAVQRPGRRELTVRSPFQMGSVSAADLAAIPADIGLRLERTGTLPQSSRFPAPAILGQDAGGWNVLVQRETWLDDGRTAVHDTSAAESGTLPVEIVASPERRASVEDILKSVLTNRAAAPIRGRFARLELVANFAPAPALDAIPTPWMADAVGRIWQDMARRGSLPSRLRFSAEGDRLVIRADSTIADSVLADLTRSVLAAMAPAVEQPQREILPIPDARLRAWSRDPGPAAVPPPIQRPWDGRWFWLLALALLAFEAWLRRRRSTPHAGVTEPSLQEQSRVA